MEIYKNFLDSRISRKTIFSICGLASARASKSALVPRGKKAKIALVPRGGKAKIAIVVNVLKFHLSWCIGRRTATKMVRGVEPRKFDFQDLVVSKDEFGTIR